MIDYTNFPKAGGELENTKDYMNFPKAGGEPPFDPPFEILGRAMTAAERSNVLKMIAVAWEQQPHFRLGQLLCNAHKGDLFYVEDETLAKQVAVYANEHRTC